MVIGLALSAAGACSGESTVLRGNGAAGKSASGGSTGSGASSGIGGSATVGGRGGRAGVAGRGNAGTSPSPQGGRGVEEPAQGGAPDDGGTGNVAGSGVVPRGGAAGTLPFGGGGAGPAPVGGMGGHVNSCEYPPVDLVLGDWVAAEPGTPAEVSARLTTYMVGDWYGVADTPWTPPYVVTLSFTEDLSYSARCVWASNQCCVAFYYGTDDDSDLKRFQLGGVDLDGAGLGELDIVFGQPGSYYESGYQGALQNIELDATLDRMRFEFFYDTYGPIEFYLRRQGEAPPR